MSRFPLHFQIFAALAIGAVIGLAVNPGDTELPDASLKITRQADGTFTLSEQRADGTLVYEDSQPDAEAVRRRYRQATEALLSQDNVPATTPINVSRRRAHFSEDASGITVRYTRRYETKTVVHSLSFASGAKLRQEAPHLATAYASYAESPARPVTIVAKAMGDLFLRLLKMITIPLIVTSLITGVTGLGSTTRLGAMFGRTLLYYVATSVLAITTGIVMVNLIRPGIGVELPGGGSGALAGEEQSLGGVFRGLLDNMIPPNPVASLAGGDFLAIITFSILLGIFIIRAAPASRERMSGFFSAAFDVMMGMTLFIIRLAPIGVLGFIVYATASQGLEVFSTFGWYMATVFFALMFHACVVLPMIVLVVARRSPLQFARDMSPALLTAFSTASSNGTLPLTLTSVEERAGVSNRVSSFVLPLGATINMDGTALYEAVAVLFIAQAYNGFVMPLSSQIIVAVTALLASVGAAGIPSAGLVMMAIVLQAVGLPLDAQGLIIAVDRVLDMCRTSVNVWSDSCGCAVLDRFERTEEPPAQSPRSA